MRAAAVVLAAGGGLRGEADALGVGSTNHPDATPEVLRLALELGAEGRELDSWQRHPTGSVWPEALAGYALPETTRARTAPRCTTPTGSASSTSSPRATSWPRPSSTPWRRAAARPPRTAARASGSTPPRSTARTGPGFTAERLAYVHKRYLKAGVDITRERVLVYPVLHYRNGGLAIDERAATSLPALFAAGEIAGGVHGSNRLMGNSLLDTVVYGRRAGRSAAEVSR